MQKDTLAIESIPSPVTGVTVLRLSGNITLSTCFDLQDRLRAETSEHLILDLSNVQFVDSSGIGCLVNGYVSHHMMGGRMVLAGVNKRILTALHETRVNQFFSFFPSVEEALAGLGTEVTK